MQERQRLGRSRFAALLAVLALHVTVLTGLVVAARTRILITPTAPPIELLILPRNAAPTVPPPPNLSDRREKVTAAPLPPPPDALTVITPNPTSEDAGPPIDWSQEAHRAAASIAKGTPALNDSNAAPPSNAPLASPPAHHKGEQVPTSNGDVMIFVTDHCYQLARVIPTTPTAVDNGMGLQTYCIRDSNKPRADLFDQLPAYKKLHPDN
jgi:hypothetical protein